MATKLTLAGIVNYAFTVPCMEVFEVAGGFWFHWSYTDRIADTDALMQAQYVWLILACINLGVRRCLTYWLDPCALTDVYSYPSILRRFAAAWHAAVAMHPANDATGMVQYRIDDIKLVEMRAQWIHWCVSAANSAIVGFAHLRAGITAASAMTQTPSIFIVVWTIVVYFHWNRVELAPPAVPPPTVVVPATSAPAMNYDAVGRADDRLNAPARS